MKVLVLFILIAFLFSSCEATDMVSLCRKDMCEEVSPYGLLNEELKRADVIYEVNKFSVLASIILVETVVFPVWLIGWYAYKPIKLKEFKLKGELK